MSHIINIQHGCDGEASSISTVMDEITKNASYDSKESSDGNLFYEDLAAAEKDVDEIQDLADKYIEEGEFVKSYYISVTLVPNES